jgi:aldehyde:ferredoxin oxidoreductase
MSIRGACHLSHADLFAEQGGVVMPEAGIEGPYIGQSSDGKANLVFVTENLGALLQSMGMCMFGSAPLDLDDFVNMLNSCTGHGYTKEELLKIGERLWLLKRSISNMMGVTVDDDKLPKKILTATTEGGQAGSVPDIEAMMKEYYDIRGLEINGVPKKDVLAAAGLADIAEKL